MSSLLSVNKPQSAKAWIYSFGVVALISGLLAVWTETLALTMLPLILIVLIVTVLHYPALYYLLFLMIPFSIEVYLPNGLGTDLPSEILMMSICLLFLLCLIQQPKRLKHSFYSHPISLLLLLHVGWILCTAITSQDLVVSLKFFLAKSWYVIPFYFFLPILLEKEDRIRKLLYWFGIGLVGAASYVFIRHALVGFSFKEIHFVVGPFFRNHVTYGSLLSIAIPLTAYLFFHRYTHRNSLLWLLITLFIAAAMYLSYTRATYIAFLGSLAMYFVIRWKWTRWAILLSVIASIVVVFQLVNDNEYLEYAPDFNKAITHYEFESLLDATAKGEDISTMERVYRWVAGMNMIQEKFWVGFGPGNFYNYYKSYTESSFKTYVSDNPDKSGIHSYYLMTFVEQGIIGIIIFVTFCFSVLLYGEKVYHLTTDPARRNLLMACLLCFFQILVILLINDLIESDKVGPLFFFTASVITYFGIKASENNATRKNDQAYNALK